MAAARVNLNLASQPFGHRRLFWLASALLISVLAALAVGLVFVYATYDPAVDSPGAGAAELQARLRALAAEEAQLRAKLQEPGNDQVLARSQFLNQLLFRKGISWTRTFADLESILPPRVRVTLIRPEVTTDNKVLLDMGVGAETQADFIDFLKVLEESEWFGSPEMRSSSPPTENNPLHQFRVLVSYDQKL